MVKKAARLHETYCIIHRFVEEGVTANVIINGVSNGARYVMISYRMRINRVFFFFFFF